MARTTQNKTMALWSAMIFTLGASVATAAPTITGVDAPPSTELAQNSTITITGSGFGSKAQAAPILYDTVDMAYENGILNDKHSQLSNGDIILSTNENPDSIWVGPSNTANGASRIQVTSDRPDRHFNSSEHYYFKGFNGFVGKPVSYGGESGFDTPVDNPKLYVSWWYKPKYSPSRYWRIDTLNQEGNFIPGEQLNINGISASFIGVDDENMLNLVFHQHVTANDLKGQLVRGSQSTATTTFPEVFKGGGDFGYLTPGSQKYIRIWEDPNGKEGIRFSWTQMHQTLADRNGVEGVVNWESNILEGDEWHHMEIEMDTDQGRIDLYVDSDPITGFDFSPALEEQGKWSPTVALLGLNGKVGKFQESDFDDIYIDNSFRRVVLADANTLDSASRTEIQFPINWSDQSIELTLQLGAFEAVDNLYLFVSDQNGDFSVKGYPLCIDCLSPPSPPRPL